MVLSYVAAPETLSDQVQDLTTFGYLTHVKLRNQLPSERRARIALDGDVERPFPVDKASNVGIQPFLLIDRT